MRLSSPMQHPKKSQRPWVDLVWGLLFVCGCFAVYHLAVAKDEKLLVHLASTHQQLQVLKEEALQLRSDLVAQIESHTDPEWVELLLKEKLGVVPRGQTKTFFEFSDNP